MKALTKTDFHFEGQKSVYHGKVRDVYDINDDVIVRNPMKNTSAICCPVRSMLYGNHFPLSSFVQGILHSASGCT